MISDDGVAKMGNPEFLAELAARYQRLNDEFDRRFGGMGGSQ
jgi:hypothetical protein